MGINENLHRNITHDGYKYDNKLFDDWLPKMICREFLETRPVKKGSFSYLSDEFIKKKAGAWVGPAVGLFACVFFLGGGMIGTFMVN